MARPSIGRRPLPRPPESAVACFPSGRNAMASNRQAAVVGPELVPIPGAAALKGEGPHAVSAGGVDLILLRHPRLGPRGFQGRCPHQGALLGEGELEGETLICRNHRWRFHAATGKRQGGPECLVACPVVEQGGELLVDLTAMLAERGPVVARRRIDDLPGPRGLPWLGNALQLDLPRLHAQAEEWA